MTESDLRVFNSLGSVRLHDAVMVLTDLDPVTKCVTVRGPGRYVTDEVPGHGAAGALSDMARQMRISFPCVDVEGHLLWTSDVLVTAWDTAPQLIGDLHALGWTVRREDLVA